MQKYDTYSLRYCIKGYLRKKDYHIVGCGNSIYIAFPPKMRHKPLIIKVGYISNKEKKEITEVAMKYGFMPYNVRGLRGEYKTRNLVTNEIDAELLPDITSLLDEEKKNGEKAERIR